MTSRRCSRASDTIAKFDWAALKKARRGDSSPTVEFFDAGHGTWLRSNRCAEKRKTLFYTGDACFHDQTILKKARFEGVCADVMIMETNARQPRRPHWFHARSGNRSPQRKHPARARAQRFGVDSHVRARPHAGNSRATRVANERRQIKAPANLHRRAWPRIHRNLRPRIASHQPPAPRPATA